MPTGMDSRIPSSSAEAAVVSRQTGTYLLLFAQKCTGILQCQPAPPSNRRRQVILCSLKVARNGRFDIFRTTSTRFPAAGSMRDTLDWSYARRNHASLLLVLGVSCSLAFLHRSA
jgi:hypothetical protein